MLCRLDLRIWFNHFIIYHSIRFTPKEQKLSLSQRLDEVLVHQKLSPTFCVLRTKWDSLYSLVYKLHLLFF